jgi:predicted NUDIX family NTP pyrophosphohydrolase
MDADKLIELDPVEQENGAVEQGWAVEADWHEIPSLKSMLYEDALQIMEKIREMEKGSFFAFKEALKKVLPHQYAFLKELKEILSDRNSTKNI